MSNEIVKYHNDLSDLPLRNFKSNELDLLMVFCNKFKDKSSEELKLSFEDIVKLAKYDGKNNHRLAEDIRNTNKKLLELNIMLRDAENPGRTVQFALFTRFITDEENKTLTAKINPDFQWILNELMGKDGGYTSFELQQFVGLKSSYAKACFRQLKRFKDTGFWTVSVDKFRELLDVPKSYSMSDIGSRVLKPIEEELAPYFEYLTIEKKYEKGKRGRPKVIGFEFHFKPEEHFKDQKEKPKKVPYPCPICGGELIERKMNGKIAFCHADGHEDGAVCSAVFNSLDELIPSSDDRNLSSDDQLTEEQHENKKKISNLIKGLFG